MENETPPNDLRRQAIHRHSFWLYSVIVGLSLEEVLRHVLPDITALFHSPQLYMYLEFCRLAVFLTLIVRFYLGSVSFFNKVHSGRVSVVPRENKGYTNDFFFGLIHFSAFFGLGLNIGALPLEASVAWYLPNMFMGWLSFILFYDVIWVLLCWRYDSRNHVIPWAAINILNLIVSTMLYFLAKTIAINWGYSTSYQQFFGEIAFLAPIFVISIFDILEVFDEQPRIANGIRSLFRTPIPQQQSGPVDLLEPEMNEPNEPH